MGITFSKLNPLNFERLSERILGKSAAVMPQKESVGSDENAINASQQIWKSFGTFNLTEDDKNILLVESDILNNNIMNSALFLLKQQFPGVNGLQNVSLNDINLIESGFGLESGFKFLQIINYGSDHWIVISNIMTENPEKEVKIYDCKHNLKQKYSIELNAAIIRFMNNVRNIKVVVPHVSQQEFSHQSGLYAIAFAHALCSGEDPSQILFAYMPSVLRIHLIQCLEKGCITTFPKGNTCKIGHYHIKQ